MAKACHEKDKNEDMIDKDSEKNSGGLIDKFSKQTQACQEELLCHFIACAFKQQARNKQNYTRKRFKHLHQAPFTSSSPLRWINTEKLTLPELGWPLERKTLLMIYRKSFEFWCVWEETNPVQWCQSAIFTPIKGWKLEARVTVCTGHEYQIYSWKYREKIGRFKKHFLKPEKYAPKSFRAWIIVRTCEKCTPKLQMRSKQCELERSLGSSSCVLGQDNWINVH